MKILITSRNNYDNATYDNRGENNDNDIANIFDNLIKLNQILIC